MAAVTPSGSSGAVVEITNTSIAPAHGFVVVSLNVIPGIRALYAFPDGCTNITFKVRQPNVKVRFYSSLYTSGYYTTDSYSSGQVNTKQVTFCWESTVHADVEVLYWGPAGVTGVESYLLRENGELLLTENNEYLEF